MVRGRLEEEETIIHPEDGLQNNTIDLCCADHDHRTQCITKIYGFVIFHVQSVHVFIDRVRGGSYARLEHRHDEDGLQNHCALFCNDNPMHISTRNPNSKKVIKNRCMMRRGVQKKKM